MPGEFFFMAVGGLGVTLAGFAGLIAVLDRRAEARDPVAVWRIRNVVYQGFGVTFVGFGTVALHSFTDDVVLTARLASLLVVGMNSGLWWPESRPSPAWPDERVRKVLRAIVVGFALAGIANVVLASVGFLQVLLLIMLLSPAGIFVNAVAELAGDDGTADTTGKPEV